VAFSGLAAILLLAGGSSGTGFRQHALMAVAVTFFVSSVIALAATRGRHPSWVVFLAIALLVVLAAE
jgi:hypothetical protein